MDHDEIVRKVRERRQREQAERQAKLAPVPLLHRGDNVQSLQANADALQQLVERRKLRSDFACKFLGRIIKNRASCQGGPIHVCEGGYGECTPQKCIDYHYCGDCNSWEKGPKKT